jgi:hypothetical protein
LSSKKIFWLGRVFFFFFIFHLNIAKFRGRINCGNHFSEFSLVSLVLQALKVMFLRLILRNCIWTCIHTAYDARVLNLLHLIFRLWFPLFIFVEFIF